MLSGTLTLDTVPLDTECNAVYLLTDDDIPADGTATYEASLDGGTTWAPIASGDITALGHAGTSLAVRATLTLDETSEATVTVTWMIAYATTHQGA